MMILNDNVLQSSEKIIFALRELYLSCGYHPYHMSKFEEYDLYAGNKDFLVSDNVITFTDTDGKLMALRPDVTLSIIKNSIDAPDKTQKVFYNENVYRVSKGSGSFQENMQAGVECFGRVEEKELCEVLTLAGKSLRLLSAQAVLAVSDLSILADIIAGLKLDSEQQKQLYQAIGEKNLHGIDAVCAQCSSDDAVGTLKELLAMSGSLTETLPKLDALLGGMGLASYAGFRSVFSTLAETALAEMLRIDFSVIDDVNYYNGIVFKGFVREIPVPVLSGGQYDRLMQKFKRRSRAIGFAVYTDNLKRIRFGDETANGAEDDFVNVALPKGRLGEIIYEQFAAAGFECPSILEANRKLIFENPEKGVRYFWVKPSDVAIYVERGAADIGVAGKDILLEYEPDVYELLDLRKGKCAMAVAAPQGFVDDETRTLRVATKFTNIAKSFYRAKGRDIDIIHLNGSIELAPILKLSDVIVDIVETGTTLRENNLEVIEKIVPVTARLIANKSAFKFKNQKIEKIIQGLARITEVEK